MNDLEERLRAATRAAAGQITPDRIPPPPAPPPGRLHRAAPGLARRTGASALGQGRWQARLAPVAAAAAVVALVTGSLGLAHAIGRPAASKTGHVLPGASSGSAGVPPYYATLRYSGGLGYAQPGGVQFRLTATGAVRAVAQPPSGEEFTAVSAADDDSTFVASAATHAQVARWIADTTSSGSGSGTSTSSGTSSTSTSSGTSSSSTSTSTSSTGSMLTRLTAPARFYLLRFDPRTGTVQTRPLPIPELPDVSDFALSPDGSSLAVALATQRTITVRVYSLASGWPVTWTAATHQGGHYRYLGIRGLSWSGARGLAFAITPADRANPPFGVLSTATAGGSLFADSTMYPPGPCYPWLVTQDGKLIITVVVSGGRDLLRECAISNGHVRLTVPGLAVRYRHGIANVQGPLWASATGRKIILATSGAAMTNVVTGVLHGHTLDPLPGPPIPPAGLFPGNAASW